MIIYKTTNILNGKIYVGLDTHNNPKYFGSGKLLNFAIEKYGLTAFKKEIIDNGETIKELNEKEKYWIATLSANNRIIGYNICGGGWSDDDTRRKISNTLKGRKMPEITKLKISKTLKYQIENGLRVGSMTGKKHTKEWKEYISKINSGHKNKMFGKSVDDIWISKYGIEKAKILKDQKRIKASNSLIGHKNPRSIKVICIETSEIFDCIKYAEEWLNSINKKGNIYQAIYKKYKAGGYTWKLLEE